VRKDLLRNALFWAERRGLIRVERRRVARDGNAPNIITIVDRRWIAWLRLGPRRPRPWGGCFKTLVPTPYKSNKKEASEADSGAGTGGGDRAGPLVAASVTRSAP
jgi:hypothetical protein